MNIQIMCLINTLHVKKIVYTVHALDVLIKNLSDLKLSYKSDTETVFSLNQYSNHVFDKHPLSKNIVHALDVF